VPGAVATRVADGLEVPEGERQVTVLFADLRGYTGIAERSATDEIFGTLNRYTETVSAIVNAHGGAVVDFSGDGVMVVFGAPDALPDKERAAILAAREIVAATARLEPPPGTGGRPLAVGVGVATGSAFVGTIRSVDRWIWSVVGNTTNLAARLQALTREIGAVVAVDGPTRSAAGALCDDFVDHGAVAIRGRAEPVSVFSLPLEATPRSGAV
jgi:adenylate cyclase